MAKEHPIEVNIDTTEDIPDLKTLRTYHIPTMRVRTDGPGGGNPCVTLAFDTHTDLMNFMTSWYGVEENDVGTYVNETMAPPMSEWVPAQIRFASSHERANRMASIFCGGTAHPVLQKLEVGDWVDYELSFRTKWGRVHVLRGTGRRNANSYLYLHRTKLPPSAPSTDQVGAYQIRIAVLIEKED